jgi:hypothetical protein
MSKELIELMRLAEALTPEEQLSLISYLIQRFSLYDITPKPRHNVMEFAGIAPNHLGGMDAQEYITRLRRGEFPELEIEEMESRKQE